MKVYITHTMIRGKNNHSLVGIKIEKVFLDKGRAEEYAGKLACKETIVNGELVEIRVGLTEVDVEE